MAYTPINNSSLNFNTKLYTGNGGTNAITGVGFEPSFTWLKERNAVSNHRIFDAVRGVTKYLEANGAPPNQTDANSLTAFGTDGFTLGSSASVNASGNTFASWNFKANGQGSSNTDGSINTTYTSVNTTAGFSISQYTGTGANATFGHGLGVTPKIIIWKNITTNNVNWIVQSPLFGNQNKLVLNTTEATSSNSSFSETNNWTNALIDLKTYEGQNTSGNNYIAYCFAEVQGYSKVGSYFGSGNDDGPFLYTGFKPAFILFKKTDSTSEWFLYDNKRLGFNVLNSVFEANTTSAEAADSATYIDMVSNGFKIRGNSGNTNTNGSNYIFMAFGQSLVGTNNVPNNAR